MTGAPLTQKIAELGSLIEDRAQRLRVAACVDATEAATFRARGDESGLHRLYRERLCRALADRFVEDFRHYVDDYNPPTHFMVCPGMSRWRRFWSWWSSHP